MTTTCGRSQMAWRLRDGSLLQALGDMDVVERALAGAVVSPARGEPDHPAVGDGATGGPL